MRFKLYLICLCLLPIPLLADVNVDSLITLYEQNNNPQHSAITQQLIDYFIQEDFYDYPVTPKFQKNKDLSNMLVYLGTANYYYFENRFSVAHQYAEKALWMFQGASMVLGDDLLSHRSGQYHRRGRA